MFQDFKFAYLIFILIFALVWLALFCYRKDLRHQMWVMSLLVAPMGPLSELLYTKDYWTPSLSTYSLCIQDLLWAFFIGGITSVLYEELFAKKYSKRHARGRPFWLLAFIIFLISWMVLGNIVLGLNSMYVSVAAMLIMGILMITIRHDLFKDAFYSALLVGTLLFISYLIFLPFFPGIIQQWWHLENLSGILIFGIPIEELMWGFGWGIVAGPIYEFITGLRSKTS